MKLKECIDRSKEPMFVCVGTPKSIMDSVAPRIGTKLRELGYNVIGTVEEPLHALNLVDKYETDIKTIDKSKFEVIAIDATLDFGDLRGKKKVYIDNTPIRPGKGAGKNLPYIGDVSIKADVSYHYTNQDVFLLDLISGNGDKEFVEELIKLILDEITECYPLTSNLVNTFQAFI